MKEKIIEVKELTGSHYHSQPYLVKISGNGCWDTVSHLPNTWGYIELTRQNKHVFAHRLSYEAFIGIIPIGLNVLHTCDNPACVNPKHLWLGTIADNNRDRANKNRNRDQNGEKNNLSKLTKSQILKIRKLRKHGLTLTQIAREFNIASSHVSRIANKKEWTHIKGEM